MDDLVTDAHPHPWQEYNEYGNTCHHPGCALTEDQHAGSSRPAPISEHPRTCPCTWCWEQRDDATRPSRT